MAVPVAMAPPLKALCPCLGHACSSHSGWQSIVTACHTGGDTRVLLPFPRHISRLFSPGWTSCCQHSTNLFATHIWFPRLGIRLQQGLSKSFYQLSHSMADFVKQIYGRVIWTTQPPNEQKKDCLYQGDFRNSHFCSLWFALELHSWQKTCIS